MHFTILLFAQLAESIGTRSIQVDLPNGATVANLLDALSREHPPIAAMKGTLAVAIDERYARMDTVILEGRTIALIPPVSGG